MYLCFFACCLAICRSSHAISSSIRAALCQPAACLPRSCSGTFGGLEPELPMGSCCLQVLTAVQHSGLQRT